MLFTIRSMGSSMEKYRPFFEGRLDWDKYVETVPVANTNINKTTEILQNVYIHEMDDLHALFTGFEEPMGHSGQITINVDTRTIWILDDYIE